MVVDYFLDIPRAVMDRYGLCMSTQFFIFNFQNEWIHVVITCDSQTNDTKLYINTVLKDSENDITTRSVSIILMVDYFRL